MIKTTKPLATIAVEVRDNNIAKGWYNDEHTFGEMAALLHSEISEALEAWRNWKLEDATDLPFDGGPLAKPEGVGSEFADILIRLVDDCYRSDIDLAAEVENHHGLFGVPDRFGDQICALHRLVSRVCNAWDNQLFGVEGELTVGQAYASVYVYLTQLCNEHGIDLEAEYERKMAFNRTRPWRHGGKTL